MFKSKKTKGNWGRRWRASPWCMKNLRKSAEGPHTLILPSSAAPENSGNFTSWGDLIEPFLRTHNLLKYQKCCKLSTVNTGDPICVSKLSLSASPMHYYLTSSHYYRVLRKWHFSKWNVTWTTAVKCREKAARSLTPTADCSQNTKRTHLCVTDSQHQRGLWKGLQISEHPIARTSPKSPHISSVETFNTTPGICGIFKTLKSPAMEKGGSKETL